MKIDDLDNFQYVYSKYFYSRSENRLHAFWRLLMVVFLGLSGLGVMSILALFIIAAILMLIGQVPFSVLGNGQELAQAINTAIRHLPILLGIRSLIVLGIVGLAFILLARWIDRRS